MKHLREANVDLVIGVLAEPDHSLRSVWLFDTGYVLAMREDHPLGLTDIDLDEFLAARHLLATMSGDAHGVVDSALSKQGLERRVVATVNHFSAVPDLLRKSDLVAAIPEVITGDCDFCSGLVTRDLPIDVDPTSLYLAWHARHDRDPGVIWLRDKVKQIGQDCWTRAMASRGIDCAEFEKQRSNFVSSLQI
ncbi:LysR substrate-binding domain-containing protein [Marinobacter liaoningensis]|uniref:LysR substrate-binding domain-containing protein n=1 Tax=Marinobacter sp. F4206 TaxID=2861777 RepID=UPI0027E496B4|nr:LysR substrate-binding domain-containing protein [Marinobacter sp. F4206]